MTKMYITDCTRIMNEQSIEHLLPRLERNRQKKIRAERIIQKKAQHAAAGLLLFHHFGHINDLEYNEYGKPYLADRSAYISISHSQQWVVLAVSSTEIGADIQVVSPIRPGVLRRCFTDEEREYIGKDSKRFTQLWTRREAYAKFTGRGLTAPLSQFIPDIPYCEGEHQNAFYTVFGDSSVQLIQVNLKDLL